MRHARQRASQWQAVGAQGNVVLGLLTLMLLLALVGGASAQESTEEPIETTPEVTPAAETITSGESTAPTGQIYTVQPGDNLFRIARRFETTSSALAAANGIANPSLIFVGQVLTIPGATSPTPAPATPPPAGGTVYIVQPGDTLFRIAVRNNSTVSTLAAANNIANPALIFVGQRITIPAGGTTTSATTPTSTEQTPILDTAGGVGSEVTFDPIPNAGFGYGVEIFAFNQEPAAVAGFVGQAVQLGVNWVKVKVDWGELELVQGQIVFDSLDLIVDTLEANNVNVLLTLTNAPDWARSVTGENGPPDDLTTFGTFVSAVAGRYAGRVDAYEIWDEPNIRRNWSCGEGTSRFMCRVSYADMLRIAYDAIKQADPLATVVSAGLAPTGFNDGINAINDRAFLQNLYASGGADITDAIGAHPLGWANPPDARCCQQPIGVETHYEDSSFYFYENLLAVREIMESNGDAATPIWVTKFGWGTSEDTGEPAATNIFYTYTSLAEQAIYVPRAFEIGQELGFVGPMFLDNLNGCAVSVDACYGSLLALDGTERPVFGAFANLDKTGTAIGAPLGFEETLPLGEPTETTPLPELPMGEMTPESTPQF